MTDTGPPTTTPATPTAPTARRAGAQLLRGFVMGAADVVPGVSGGTMALVLGIYERLIDTIRDGARALGRLARGDIAGGLSALRRLDLVFLVPLLAGIGLAVVSLAPVITHQLETNPEEMAGLFFGLVAASVVVAWRLVRRRHRGHVAVMAAVAVVVFVLLGFQSGPVADPPLLAYLASGALAICAMILPGISGSFILLMIGMYGAVIGAVDERAVGHAAVFGVGAVVGLAAFSHLLGWMLHRAHDWVMAALIGLMVGSLRVLWPWPDGVGVIGDTADATVSGTGLDWPAGGEWAGPVALAVVAAAAVLGFTAFAERRARI